MMRLRQIALVARDLDAACADIRAVLGCTHAYADPGVGKYGLHNAVFPIGDTFLEVVSPNTQGTTAGRRLEKRGGDGGYMVIVQTDDLAAARTRVAEAGVRIVDQIDMAKASFTHLHPKDIGGAILSIDAMNPAAHWEWGGPDWAAHAHNGVSVGITGAEIQAADPAAVARRWAYVLGRPIELDGGAFRIDLDGGTLRFTVVTDARGGGLAAFDVAVRNPAALRAAASSRGLLSAGGAVMLAGTRVNLIAAPPCA
jgi:catechol 2,3-dioxygenase-like lactoylglutathione lyase family enzyme